MACKRLLVLSSTYPRWANDSGPSFVHELSSRLANELEVVVLCPSSKGAHRIERLDGVKVIRYRYAPNIMETLVHGGGIVANIRARPLKLLLLLPFLLSQLLSAIWYTLWLRPDVIHAHWLIPQGVVASVVSLVFRGKVPFVVTSHGTDLWSFRGRILKAVKRWVVSRAAAVTAVSTALERELQLQVGLQKKVLVEPMGVDLNGVFRPRPCAHRQRKQVISAGRLIEGKGVEYLIKAIPGLVSKFPGIRVLIAGDGPDQGRLEAMVNNLGVQENCDFKGIIPHSELSDLYNCSSVFVAPFLQEGLGLVCVEALGSGIPVVVSDIPAMSDVIGLSEGIHLVAPRNESAISDAIEKVLLNLDAELAAVVTSNGKLKERYGWENVAGRYMSILGAACSLEPHG